MAEISFPYHKAIQNRLVRSTLIPIAVSGLCLLIITPFFLMFGFQLQLQKEARSVSRQLSENLSAYQSGMQQLSQDPLLHQFLKTGEESIAVYGKLYQLRNVNPVSAYFALEDAAGDTVASQLPSIPENRANPVLRYEINDHQGVIGSSANANAQRTDPIVLTLACGVREEDQILGYLYYHFTLGDLSPLLKSDGQESLLINRSDRVLISGSSAFSVFQRMEERPLFWKLAWLNGELYLTEKIPLKTLGLSVWTIRSLAGVTTLIFTELIIFLLVFALCGLFINKISRLTARTSLKSVDTLYSSLQHYSLNHTMQRLAEEDNELKPVAVQYNRILDEVESLLHRNVELEKQTKIAEIRQLQSQFNPHFIFNTLDTIKYMIAIDPLRAEDMLLMLSKLLRYSLDSADSRMADLDQDLAYIEDYLKLQKIRLGEQFRYEIQAPAHSGLKIPKMIIQPMVENSLSHGFVQDREFYLRILIVEQNNELWIRVDDNGEGISPELLAGLQEDLKSMREDVRHIGIMNSHKRIRLVFGEDYGVEIHSQLRKGTQILLKMKAVRG